MLVKNANIYVGKVHLRTEKGTTLNHHAAATSHEGTFVKVLGALWGSDPNSVPYL